MINNVDMDALQEQIEAELAKQRGRSRVVMFAVNLLLLVTFAVISWLVLPLSQPDFIYGDATLTTLILMSIGWTTGVILHGAQTLVDSRATDKALRERLMAEHLKNAALEQIRQQDGDRAKRKRVERLADDEPDTVEIASLLDDDEEQQRRA